MTMIRLVLLALLVAGCGGGLDQLAADTCAELEGAIVLQAGPILSKAVSRAESMGESGPKLGDAMRAKCPTTMAALENLNKDQKEREGLPGLMTVSVSACTNDGAAGTVRNGSTKTVDVFIAIQYLDASGVVADDGIASVSGLRAGETGKWDSSRYKDNVIDRCRAQADNAYAKP